MAVIARMARIIGVAFLGSCSTISCAAHGSVVLLQTGIETQHSAKSALPVENLDTGASWESEQGIMFNNDLFWSTPSSDVGFGGVQLSSVARSDKTAYPLKKGMQFLATRLSGGAAGVCLTIQGKGVGGVANTVSLINTVLDFTISEKFRFTQPALFIPAHNIGDSFTDLFGEANNCSKEVQLHYGFCDPAQGVAYKNGKVRCTMDQFMVDIAGGFTQKSRFCGCDKVVVLNTSEINYHFNYSRTHNKFNAWYWATHKALAKLPETEIVAPGSRHHTTLSVVVHVRLGDVAGNGITEKHKTPVLYVNVLEALYKLIGGNSKCFHVSIVTDGRSKDKDIAYILSKAAAIGMPSPTVYDVDTVDAVAAFEIMTHADVLVVGGSGFSRLAAMLLRDTGIVLGHELKSHPLGYLRNFVNLPHGAEKTTENGIPDASSVTVDDVMQVLDNSKTFRAMKSKSTDCATHMTIRSMVDKELAAATTASANVGAAVTGWLHGQS